MIWNLLIKFLEDIDLDLSDNETSLDSQNGGGTKSESESELNSETNNGLKVETLV